MLTSLNSGLDWGIVSNIIVIILLVITIVYAYILNRKISKFQSGTSELQQSTQQFVAATTQAEAATQNLKQQGEELTKRLDATIQKGENLYFDIDFLLSRAEKAALNLENKTVKPVLKTATKPAPAKPKQDTKSAAEQELLAAISSLKTKVINS